MKKTFENKIKDKFNNENELLFERVTGSRLYGTSFELGEHPFWEDYESDWDFRGVFMVDPAVKLMLPPFNRFEENIAGTEYDIEYYEIEKVFKESIKNNPNFMDLIFGGDESLIGITEKGRYILDHKDHFLSNKLAYSFKGFAESQLTRMKNHKKWFVRYPDIYDVEKTLREAYQNKDTDFDTISFHFSGSIAAKLTNELANDKKAKSATTFEEMIEKYFANKSYDIKKYMKPLIFEYLSLYKMGSGLQVDIDEQVQDYLMNHATFKKKNESLYFLYDGGDGALLNERAIKPSLTKKPNLSNPITFMMHFDFTTFKSKSEDIKSLWKWKVERNGRRSELEERFGYDTKHAMHTYRLLDGAIETFETGTYKPELSGSRLTEAKEILSGKLTYDEVLGEADVKIKKLLGMAKKGIFKPYADTKLLNKIYMEVLYSK